MVGQQDKVRDIITVVNKNVQVIKTFLMQMKVASEVKSWQEAKG